MTSKTLPYDPVWNLCTEIGTLAQAIEGTAMLMIHSGDSDHREQALFSILNTAQNIGLMADHIIDYDMRGGAEVWLHLPNMKKAEGES